jgi:hypothetical protein
MLTHTLSAVIEADDRMPKPTEEDREGYCLCRNGRRRSEKLILSKSGLFARGAGVTSVWPYTRYNCYFRVSATIRSASPSPSPPESVSRCVAPRCRVALELSRARKARLLALPWTSATARSTVADAIHRACRHVGDAAMAPGSSRAM